MSSAVHSSRSPRRNSSEHSVMVEAENGSMRIAYTSQRPLAFRAAATLSRTESRSP
ncbi:hypothetical protein SCYAM73S_06360 [Streptomyces cyaneofuscatus]